MLYFDNAATTYPKPEQVYKEMDRLTRECAVNSGRGSYKKAENASAVINETRKKVSEFMGAENAEDVIFTSSATEAANRVLRGYGFEENMTVYVSPYEHNAVMRTLEALRKEKKFKIKVLETDEKGYLNLDDIEYQFMCDEPDFVCINLASNVTGYVLPAERVADMAKEYGAIVLADAAQAAGNIEINLKETNIDILIFAGHKSMYGLFGVGGFITNSRIFDRDKNITPVIFGGNGEDSLNLELSERGISRYEVGSPNIAAIGTLKTAIDTIEKDLVKNVEKLKVYCMDHPENFYFMDVYSSVSYSEKMFVNVDNSIHNYDIMGGWASKSPLYRKKLKAYQINTMEEGLLSMENVYFVRKKAEDMHWLSNYYESHGENIKITLVETIDDVFEIYRIEAANL